jgi:hypothetical protein
VRSALFELSQERTKSDPGSVAAWRRSAPAVLPANQRRQPHPRLGELEGEERVDTPEPVSPEGEG